MTRTILRRTTSLGLALCLGLAFTPLGCGGGQEMGSEPIHHTGDGPQASEATVSQITDCVKEAKARLTDSVYAMQFDVEVTESGHAGRVRLRDASPSEGGLEACVASALEGMTSPVPVMKLISDSSVSPESRKFIGQDPITLGASGLAPIFIAAAGVTLIVMIVLHVNEEVAEAARRRREIDRKCMELEVKCLEDRRQPEWNRGTFGDYKDCTSCLGECKKHPKGKWPDYKCPRAN